MSPSGSLECTYVGPQMQTVLLLASLFGRTNSSEYSDPDLRPNFLTPVLDCKLES